MKRMIPSYLRQCDKCEQRKERIEELYEQLTAKDTTIKEQAEKIEEMKVKLNLNYGGGFTDDDIKIASLNKQIEKLTGLLKDEITKEYLNPDESEGELIGVLINASENEEGRFLTPQQAADDKWNDFKEQHGI